MTQPATKLKIKQQILLMQNDFNKEERIMALVIGSIVIFVVYPILSGLVEYIKDEWTRINRGGQNQTEQRRKMWENYSHLCKIWNPLLEKWNQFPIQIREQIPKKPIHSLAELKSTCALKVYEGKCDCNKSCNGCGQWRKDKTCVFKCKNSCFSCGQFHKYANWYVQLSESRQAEIDQLAMQNISVNL